MNEEFKQNTSGGNSVDAMYDKDGLLSIHAPHWYACQVNVNNEDAAKKILEQKVSNLQLEDKLLEVYVPNKKIAKLNKKGERVEKLEKIHPGYIYVRAVLTKEMAYIIQSSNMITRIALTGGVYAPLEDGYIERIKATILSQEKEEVTKVLTSVSLGDNVKIVDGHFKDMSGKICSINEDGSRVEVLLNMFDRETMVELDVLEVEKE
jgi:transcription termination/antitermination protein NusG